jgi:RNA polymerase sigma-70 factor (ECF subfamily)
VADDVVQDVFVAVIDDASGYQAGRSGVLPWLLGIARNHVRRWRHQRPVLPLPDDETQAGQELATTPDPVVAISRQRHRIALRRALLELPLRYRETIVLCDLQELSYADAADALGCAIGTVRSRLHRGRALLARRLGDQEAGVTAVAASAVRRTTPKLASDSDERRRVCRLPATRSVV